MFGLFKKKLHKKVLVLSALPDDKESFHDMSESGNSDFIKSLYELYNADHEEIAWKGYCKTAGNLRSTLKSLNQRGADVVRRFNLSDLEKMSGYEVIVIIAHHSDSSDEIELGDGCVRTIDFVHSIPETTKAIIDMTSCYSDYLIPRIKGRIPESRIIGIDTATSLPFRLFLLEEVIKLLAKDNSLSYLDALKNILSSLPVQNSNINLKEGNTTVHLGKKDIRSTVAAPLKALRGENFIVSVFIHKEEDKEEVELIAKSMDEDSEIRASKKIAIKFKKGDKVAFQLSMPENLKQYFTIDKSKRTIVWDGDTNSAEFIVSVAENSGVSDFMGRINVSVNQEPCCNMLFKTKIIDRVKSEDDFNCNNKYADIEFVPFDKAKEIAEANQQLVLRLKTKIHELQEAKSNSNGAHDYISKELDMCEKCLELINSKKNNVSRDVLKVFISSTSDMKDYRDVLRERVLRLGMYPDMYEMWGQDNDYPRDICCKHVLESDIFICILGPKYGFVEPMWDKSMTEIEYRIATNAGIPILIYIQKDYKNKMDELTGEEKMCASRQLDFIEELSTKRMVSLFPNENSLALLADPELLTLKYKLQS